MYINLTLPGHRHPILPRSLRAAGMRAEGRLVVAVEARGLADGGRLPDEGA